jgi:hypothetical protein
VRDEIILILGMLRDGRLNKDEARRLIEAIGDSSGPLKERTAMGAVLAMVAEGVLTPEAGADRLGTMPSRASDGQPGDPPKWVRIIVTNGWDARNSVVNVRLPIGLVHAGLGLVHLIPNHSVNVNGEPVDLDAVIQHLKTAPAGEIFRVDSGADHVDILLE